MDCSLTPPIPVTTTHTMGSYFDLVKPISIPKTTSFFHHEPEELDGILPDQDTDKDDLILPEYLQSFHDSGISDARLKRLSWLHPKNYSGEGSLSDDYKLSAYGTSVSSPRGDAWEIVDHGPRKSIDELWDEVFEYQQRIKLLEEVHQAQAAAATAAQDPSQLEHEEECRRRSLSGDDQQQQRWSDYSGGSETCYSPSFMTASGSGGSSSSTTCGSDGHHHHRRRGSGHTCRGKGSPQSISLVAFATTLATLSETPMAVSSGTMTQIDKTPVHASRKGVRSDRGSALRLLHSAFRALTSRSR